MKHLIIIGILSIITNYCFAQSETENIALEICDKLKNINFNEDTESINQKSLEAIQSTYLEKQSLIKGLMKEYSKKYPNESDVEVSKILGRDITFYLMKNCNTYLRITMFKNKPVPQISSTTENVGDDFTELLNQQIKTEKISQSMVDNCMIKAMDKNEKELIKKFGSKYSLEFTTEFQAYLMTKCEPYMKWTASLIN